MENLSMNIFAYDTMDFKRDFWMQVQFSSAFVHRVIKSYGTGVSCLYVNSGFSEMVACSKAKLCRKRLIYGIVAISRDDFILYTFQLSFLMIFYANIM